MKRHEWTFTYTASELAKQAERQLNKHTEKLKWWEEKKQSVMKQVGESGIEVKDSLAATYSNTKGLCGPEIVIDATLQRDLTEAQRKIMEHHGKIQEYTGWLQVLNGNPEERLELEHDDYLFFFGE